MHGGDYSQHCADLADMARDWQDRIWSQRIERSERMYGPDDFDGCVEPNPPADRMCLVPDDDGRRAGDDAHTEQLRAGGDW